MSRQDLPSGEALRKMAASITGACLKDIAGNQKHLHKGLPTRAYIAAHLVSREGFTPANATSFAEFVDRAVSEAIRK
jgi:hypothetical protein